MRHAASRIHFMSKYFHNYITIAIALIFLSSPICEAKQEHVIRGRTMGTTYSVKVVTGDLVSIEGVKAKD